MAAALGRQYLQLAATSPRLSRHARPPALNCLALSSASPTTQGVEKFRNCYVRYETLVAQLQAEGGGAAGPGPAAAPLLAALQAAIDSAGDSLALTAGGSGFQRAFLQEAQRLRLFVKSNLEQLWVALLDTCAALRGLGEELLQVGLADGCCCSAHPAS